MSRLLPSTLASVSLLLASGCVEGLGDAFDDESAQEAHQDWEDNGGDPTGTVLAIGDSFFDTGDVSIPGVAAEELGLEVRNVSVSGALLVDGPGDIRSQYTQADWVALLMTGGGNDLNDTCDCGACDEELDALISGDGQRGALPQFVDAVLSQGTPVVYVGYFDMPPTAEGGFAACQDELVAFRQRLEALQRASEGFVFVDPSDVISADDLDHYEEDHVHPSERGVRVAGAYVAEVVGDR